MMATLSLLLLVVAFVLFVVATFSAPSRFNLVVWGLACLTLAVLLGQHLIPGA